MTADAVAPGSASAATGERVYARRPSTDAVHLASTEIPGKTVCGRRIGAAWIQSDAGPSSDAGEHLCQNCDPSTRTTPRGGNGLRNWAARAVAPIVIACATLAKDAAMFRDPPPGSKLAQVHWIDRLTMLVHKLPMRPGDRDTWSIFVREIHRSEEAPCTWVSYQNFAARQLYKCRQTPMRNMRRLEAAGLAKAKLRWPTKLRAKDDPGHTWAPKDPRKTAGFRRNWLNAYTPCWPDLILQLAELLSVNDDPPRSRMDDDVDGDPGGRWITAAAVSEDARLRLARLEAEAAAFLGDGAHDEPPAGDAQGEAEAAREELLAGAAAAHAPLTAMDPGAGFRGMASASSLFSFALPALPAPPDAPPPRSPTEASPGPLVELMPEHARAQLDNALEAPPPKRPRFDDPAPPAPPRPVRVLAALSAAASSPAEVEALASLRSPDEAQAAAARAKIEKRAIAAVLDHELNKTLRGRIPKHLCAEVYAIKKKHGLKLVETFIGLDDWLDKVRTDRRTAPNLASCLKGDLRGREAPLYIQPILEAAKAELADLRRRSTRSGPDPPS
jgi:hypothetical protein